MPIRVPYSSRCIMRNLVAALLLSVVLVSSIHAQDPAKSGEQAKMNSLNDRLRGKMVTMQDNQGIASPTGRSVNILEIAKKTQELNALVHSVNGDVIALDKGVLSAELSQKLKKIEKLAKELRHSVE
jgi:hypothetical protein